MVLTNCLIIGKRMGRGSPPSPPQLAIALAAYSAHSRLLAATALAGGISCQSDRLTFVTADGLKEQVVVRRYHQHSAETALREFRLLQQLYACDLAVPEPLFIDQTRQRLPVDYIIMAAIDGEMLLAPQNRATYLAQYAQQLAQIHGVSEAQIDLSFLPNASQVCCEVPSSLCDELQAIVGHVDGLLLSYPPRYGNRPNLLHGDYWAGNVLWRDDRLLAVVDWEDAKVGEPLIDFAISRVETAVLFGTAACQQFSQQYQALMPIDYRDLAYWDLCAALRMARLIGSDMAQFCRFFAPFGRSDITPSYLQRTIADFVSQATRALVQPNA